MSTEPQLNRIRRSEIWQASTPWLMLPYQPFSNAKRSERALIELHNLIPNPTEGQLLATRWAFTSCLQFNSKFLTASLQLQRASVVLGKYLDPEVCESMQILRDLHQQSFTETSRCVADALTASWGLALQKEFNKSADRFIHENSGVESDNEQRKSLALILDSILVLTSTQGLNMYSTSLSNRIARYKLMYKD